MMVASTPSSFRYFIYSAVVTALPTIAIYLRPSAGLEGVRWETQFLAAIVTWVLLSSFIGGLGAFIFALGSKNREQKGKEGDIGKTIFWTAVAVSAFLVSGSIGNRYLDSLDTHSEPTGEVIAQIAAEVKQALQLPLMIDDDTELYDISGSYRRITYHYRFVNRAASDFSSSAISSEMQSTLTSRSCAEESMRAGFEMGASYIFDYVDRIGDRVGSFEVSPADCGFGGPRPNAQLRDAESGNESRIENSEVLLLPLADSLEMADLLKLFMLPIGATYGSHPWHIGAEPGSPIKWHTSGIDDSPAWPNLGPYHRRGEVILMLGGEVTHHVLKETLVPGTWDIYLFGPRSGVSTISIQSDLSHELVRPTSSLSATDLSFLEYRCSESARAVGGNVVFRVEAPNMKPAWIEEWWSCGSGGCSFILNLFLRQEDATEVECADW